MLRRTVTALTVALALSTHAAEAPMGAYRWAGKPANVTAFGQWLGRDFPLGACFKQIRRPDGTAGGKGLS